jgi:dolichyl-phosphate beta-glucosyltransferase
MVARSEGASGALSHDERSKPGAARIALSIVIPAYNEERRLGPTLDAVLDYLDAGDAGAPESIEVLVVDDGSKDGTAALVRERAERDRRTRLLSLPQNRGKGAAVRSGFLASRGALVLFSDADNSTPIAEIAKLRRAIEAGADVAIGSRGLPDSDVRVTQHALRRRMGMTFNTLVRFLGGLEVRDSQCGFKLFRRDRALAVFERQRLDGFAFDVEILFIARRMGLRIVEVPVTWINSPDSRVNIWLDPALMLRDLVLVRWNALLGRYQL